VCVCVENYALNVRYHARISMRSCRVRRRHTIVCINCTQALEASIRGKRPPPNPIKIRNSAQDEKDREDSKSNMAQWPEGQLLPLGWENMNGYQKVGVVRCQSMARKGACESRFRTTKKVMRKRPTYRYLQGP